MPKSSASNTPSATDSRRNILICALGMSPAVVTETIYALIHNARQPEPECVWVPQDLHIITALAGALKLKTLLGDLARLQADDADITDADGHRLGDQDLTPQVYLIRDDGALVDDAAIRAGRTTFAALDEPMAAARAQGRWLTAEQAKTMFPDYLHDVHDTAAVRRAEGQIIDYGLYLAEQPARHVLHHRCWARPVLDMLSRPCVRHMTICLVFASVPALGSTNAAEGMPSLFAGFVATMTESDFSGPLENRTTIYN